MMKSLGFLTNFAAASFLGSGLLRGDTLTVALEVLAGGWYPGEDNGRHETVLAFVGDTARWRWMNPTLDAHPMHLHGFYCNVHSRGGEVIDSVYQVADRRTAVTELMTPGSMMTRQFTPTVAGHWVFHCHFTFHVSHFLSFDPVSDDVDAGGPEPAGHQHAMSGLVLGINVKNASTVTTQMDVGAIRPPTRQLRVVAARATKRFGKNEGYAYIIGADRNKPLSALSETIELKRGEPVAITVVNKLRQATAVHRHGIELQDSDVDGVPRWMRK